MVVMIPRVGVWGEGCSSGCGHTSHRGNTGDGAGSEGEGLDAPEERSF